MYHLVKRIFTALVIIFTLMIYFEQPFALSSSPYIRTEKEVYAPKEEIVILFENMPGHSRDWVARAKSGAPDRRPLGGYRYLKGASSGRTTLDGLGPGEYEIRAYKGGSYEVLARFPFRVEVTAARTTDDSDAETVNIRTEKEVYAPKEEIVILFENMPGHSRDWVARAKSGAPDRRPLGGYRYLKGASSGRTTLDGLGPGEYEIRAYKGGSYEVLARFPFRVEVTAARTTDDSDAETAARKISAETLSTTEQESRVSSSQPLQGEMQRLLGTWLGHTQCDIPGSGRDDYHKIFLRIHKDSTKPTGVGAQVRGISKIAGVNMDVTLSDDGRRYLFSYAGWLSSAGGVKRTPYSLSMAFLKDRDLLHGKVVANEFSCPIVVAGKLPDVNPSPNPQGLLYKVEINRVLEPFTEEECLGYGNWLASGELSRAYGSALVFNSAVGDSAAMRRVLGHDLAQWTDEDARKIRTIHWHCRKMLRESSNPVASNLINEEPRLWGGYPPPLHHAKTKYPDIWNDTFFILHRPLLAEIRRTWELIEEGLLEETEGTATAAMPDADGLAGEWRGYYQCEGGQEFFMRLTFGYGDKAMDVRLESGSGLKAIRPFSSLAMTGSFDATSDRLTLKPLEWLIEPRGNISPLGLEGQLNRENQSIDGEVIGVPKCSSFSVVKRESTEKSVNPKGLLFHYLGRDMITAKVDDCRKYAQWLADGEEINIGGVFLFSSIRDNDAMRDVLGKDLNQWGEDDYRKFRPLSRHCKTLLESQMEPDIAVLLEQIKEKKLIWEPKPLSLPRSDKVGRTTSQWLMVEQLLMVNSRQQALAAKKLSEAENMQPEIGSIDRIDGLVKEAYKRLRGPLGYLSRQELDTYLAGLQAARIKTAVAIADATAKRWQSQPQTFDLLQHIENEYRDLRRLLEDREARRGVNRLAENFRHEAEQRADALWPATINTTVAELNDMAEADLSRFRELDDNRERKEYLMRFHSPVKGDSYYADYQSSESLYRGTVELMVERSEAQLLEWINDLPPSAGTNKLLEEFSLDVFGVNFIPERHSRLDQAVMAKIMEYNPQGYIRPDIIMSLKRGQWNEVGLVGLEDLAYLSTSLRTIKKICPGLVPEGSSTLMGFFWEFAQQAVGRILQGKVKSRQEAERAFFLLMNNLINQPGCRIDYFGNVIGCVSQQDHAAVQQFFMNSFEAQTDMRKMLSSGCEKGEAGDYVTGLLSYAAGGRDLPPSPQIVDFWKWSTENR